ncbi:hypothetical protein ACHAWU_009011 [Discostella pseudostelligera]|uniref:Uncharacterized protein n=1 Tax=Discostella pseudostelligera TaxID=259834 RepID=A0ABD3MGB2_9STRA
MSSPIRMFNDDNLKITGENEDRIDSSEMRNSRDQEEGMLLGSNDHAIQDDDMMIVSSSTAPSPFEGSRTKFGRRKRNNIDRQSNNARVRHSYLKILLEDAVFDQLHHTTCQLQRQWEWECSSNNNNASGKEVDEQIPPQQSSIRSKKQSHRQVVTILPRSRSSLHMTYFFWGKVLDTMTSEDVQRWHSMVNQCVYMACCSESATNDDGKDYSLEFKSLITFPPGRNNLLVATFEPSMALVELYERLWHSTVSEKEQSNSSGHDDVSASLEKEFEFPLLRDMIVQQHYNRKQAKPSWFAHVTLASIVGGTKDEKNRFREWLNDKVHPAGKHADTSNKDEALLSKDSIANFEAELEVLQSFSINAMGVGFGGPLPDVPELDYFDWKFPFSDAKVDTTTTDATKSAKHS